MRSGRARLLPAKHAHTRQSGDQRSDGLRAAGRCCCRCCYCCCCTSAHCYLTLRYTCLYRTVWPPTVSVVSTCSTSAAAAGKGAASAGQQRNVGVARCCGDAANMGAAAARQGRAGIPAPTGGPRLHSSLSSIGAHSSHPNERTFLHQVEVVGAVAPQRTPPLYMQQPAASCGAALHAPHVRACRVGVGGSACSK